LALGFSVVGLVAGSIRNLIRKEAFPIPTFCFVLASSLCGMIAHMVWQSNVQCVGVAFCDHLSTESYQDDLTRCVIVSVSMHAHFHVTEHPNFKRI
jgi:hypothetical protein